MYIPKLHSFALLLALLTAASIEAPAQAAAELDPVKCWAYETPEAAGMRLASDGATVFVGYLGAKVDALSIDGKKVWGTELGGDITSNLLPGNDALFLITTTTAEGKLAESTIRSLSKETGITSWTLKLNGGSNHFLGAFNGAVIVVSDDGVIHSLDAKTGAIKWKREITNGFVGEPFFNGMRMTVAGKGRQIFYISMATGEMESLRKSEFGVTALGETSLGTQIAGDERGNVTSFANGGVKPDWKFKTGGAISALSPVGDSLLVTSHDNFVYLLTSRNGGVAWKKRLSGRVPHLATLRNRYIVAAATDESAATVTDAATGKVVGQIAFAKDERLVHDPATSGNLIFLLTDRAAYSYSTAGCGTNEEGGSRPKAPPPPI